MHWGPLKWTKELPRPNQRAEIQPTKAFNMHIRHIIIYNVYNIYKLRRRCLVQSKARIDVGEIYQTLILYMAKSCGGKSDWRGWPVYRIIWLWCFIYTDDYVNTFGRYIIRRIIDRLLPLFNLLALRPVNISNDRLSRLGWILKKKKDP